MLDIEVSKLFAAIAHPNRLKILRALREYKILCGCEMLPYLGLEQSNLSRHLGILLKAGILTAWKDGVRVYYKIKDERIYDLLKISEDIVGNKIFVRS